MFGDNEEWMIQPVYVNVMCNLNLNIQKVNSKCCLKTDDYRNKTKYGGGGK